MSQAARLSSRDASIRRALRTFRWRDRVAGFMSDSLVLKCPSCGSPIRAEDFDAVKGAVKCSYCAALITLPGSSPGGQVPGPRPLVPLPPGMTLKQTAGGIEMERRWFTPAVFFMLFFCIGWDSFLVFWYSMALQPGAPWIMGVFPIAHLAIGVGLTYTTLATLFNKTRIKVDRGLVSVTHGPLPWTGQISLSADEIDQLFCKEKVSSRRNVPRLRYEVWAVLRRGESKRIGAEGLDQDQALFIEQEIERALNIKPRAVAGEITRY